MIKLQSSTMLRKKMFNISDHLNASKATKRIDNSKVFIIMFSRIISIDFHEQYGMLL